MVETARVQYVFLDIVGFTNDRSVEAQSDIVGTLNDIVTAALEAVAPDAETIFLPTGDGMAVALLNVLDIDAHLRLALEILRRTAEHNANTQDPMRRFEVRIGINENIDNVVTDINGHRNVAGAGISMAQRIMDKADAGQILVGQTVYEILRHREQFMHRFCSFQAIGKHGVQFTVHQLVLQDTTFLNTSAPTIFVVGKPKPIKLTNVVAYYMAHAVKNRGFLEQQEGDPGRDYAATVLLWFLAEDSVDASGTPTFEEPLASTWKAGEASFEDQYRHYCGMEFGPLSKFAHLLEEKYLYPYSQYFDKSAYGASYAFVNPSGLQKIQDEWPAIARELGLVEEEE